MENTGGLDNLTPAIIKFPIEKIIKAIVNLELNRKKVSSYARLVAGGVGLIIGYLFPQIGAIMAVLITLVSLTPLNPAFATSITLLCSMVLTSAVMIYLVKKTFQYYYAKKYGFSNPESRLTDHDLKLLAIKFSYLDSSEYKKLIARIEKQIVFLVHEMKKFKLLKQYDQHENVKYVVNCLKMGDISAFNDYYNEQQGQSVIKNNTRQQQLERLVNNDIDIDSSSEGNSNGSNIVKTTNARLYALKKAKASNKKAIDQEEEDLEEDKAVRAKIA